MWQNRFERRLELEPTSSRYLLIYLLLLHALAMLVLLQPLRLPVWLEFILAISILFSLLYQVWRFYQQRQRTVTLVWRSDDKWDYRDERLDVEYATLLADSYITRFLIVLHLQPLQGSAMRVVLLPDMIPKAQWHRLWLRLKFADLQNA